MSELSSQESSFDDSGIFTHPTMDKFLIKQQILSHWRSKARTALLINSLFATAWIIADILLLCKRVVHVGDRRGTGTADCDWHGIVAPSLLLFASLLGSCVLLSVKNQDISASTETRLRLAKNAAYLSFAVVVVAAFWTQGNIIVKANELTELHKATPNATLTLAYKHDPYLLYLEYGLSFVGVVASLAMAVALGMLAKAVHNFANLEKLMGQFITRISPQNTDT